MLTPEIIIDTEAKFRNVERVWRLGHKGKGVVVALVDTGVDAAALPAGALHSQEDLTPDGDGRDHHGHGTLMARFILGMAPEAKIASVKAFGKSHQPTREDLVRALDHCLATTPRPKFINCSFAVPRRFLLGFSNCTLRSQCVLCRRVNELFQREAIAVVAAAGNFGSGPDSFGCPANARWASKVRSLENLEKFSWRELARGLVPSADGEDRGTLLGTSQAAALQTGSLALISSAFPDKPGGGIAVVMYASGVALGVAGREIYPHLFDEPKGQRLAMPNVYRTYAIFRHEREHPGTLDLDKSLHYTREMFKALHRPSTLEERLNAMTLALKHDESNYLAWLGASLTVQAMNMPEKAEEFLRRCNELLPPAEAFERQQIFGGAP